MRECIHECEWKSEKVVLLCFDLLYLTCVSYNLHTLKHTGKWGSILEDPHFRNMERILEGLYLHEKENKMQNPND